MASRVYSSLYPVKAIYAATDSSKDLPETIESKNGV
jgi:hypothetical protein